MHLLPIGYGVVADGSLAGMEVVGLRPRSVPGATSGVAVGVVGLVADGSLAGMEVVGSRPRFVLGVLGVDSDVTMSVPGVSDAAIGERIEAM